MTVCVRPKKELHIEQKGMPGIRAPYDIKPIVYFHTILYQAQGGSKVLHKETWQQDFYNGIEHNFIEYPKRLSFLRAINPKSTKKYEDYTLKIKETGTVPPIYFCFRESGKNEGVFPYTNKENNFLEYITWNNTTLLSLHPDDVQNIQTELREHMLSDKKGQEFDVGYIHKNFPFHKYEHKNKLPQTILNKA